MTDVLTLGIDAQFLQDPYPRYRELLAAPGPCWLAHEADAQTPGLWLFSRYADVLELLRMSTQQVSKEVARVLPQARLSPLDLTLMNMDPPAHTQMRQLCAPAFSLESISAMEPRIEAQVDALIEGMRKKAQADFVTDFAVPLPVAIISGMMGIDRRDQGQLLGWVTRILAGTDSTQKNAQVLLDQQQAFGGLLHFFDGLIAQRQQSPSDDLIGQMVQASAREAVLSPQVLRCTCAFLLVTGYETTVSAMGTGMYTLLRHPDQWHRLQQQPEGIATAVEEMLRYESPLQRSTFRIVAEDCVIGGHRLHRGEQVGAILGAANRDPSVFAEPDRFLIDRKPNRHLVFGSGIHVCLGAILARTEMRIAFSRLAQRLPDMQLRGDGVWKPNTLIRALQSLPVTCV